MRTCTVCGRLDPECGFYDAKRSRCKDCATRYARDKYRTDPEYREKQLAYSRDYARGKKYGLTPEDYAGIVERQGGVCRGCLKDVKLFVDHDHATGVVRALLCFHCNLALGHTFDNVAILRNLIDLLENGR